MIKTCAEKEKLIDELTNENAGLKLQLE